MRRKTRGDSGRTEELEERGGRWMKGEKRGEAERGDELEEEDRERRK